MRRGAVLMLSAAIASCGMPPREDLPQVQARSDWAQWPKGDVGEVSAVDVDSHGHVFVLHRPGREWKEPFPSEPIAAPVVAMFDGSGKLLGQWGAGQTVMPHGLSVAPDDSVWITDDQREQLLHFSHDGALVETLGTRGVSGEDATHFGRPTDVAPTRNALYVADGYTNHRIMRIGSSVVWWGEEAGTDAGFHVPHSVDALGARLVVADREYSRIKVYDHAGRLLAIYRQKGHPYAAKWLPDGRILVLQGRDNVGREMVVLRLLDKDGKELRAVDLTRNEFVTRGHDLAIGRDGTIYIADVAARRVLTLPLSELTKE